MSSLPYFTETRRELQRRAALNIQALDLADHLRARNAAIGRHRDAAMAFHRNLLVHEEQPEIRHRAHILLEDMPIPMESMLLVGLLAVTNWYDHPMVFLLAFGTGNLISAFHPSAEVAVELVGEFCAGLLQTFLESESSNDFITVLLLLQGALIIAKKLPLIGGLASAATTPFAWVMGFYVGNYVWRRQITTWEGRHPEPGDGEAPPSFFQIRELAERLDQYVADYLAPLPDDAPQERVDSRAEWQQWYTDHHLSLIPRALQGLCGIVGYRPAREFEGEYPMGATGVRILLFGALGIWSTAYHASHTFAFAVVVSAYLCATSETVEHAFADNPIVETLPPGAIVAIVAATATIGSLMIWGFANGLATAAYWRGPFNFSSYQILGWAYANTLFDYAYAATLGALIGQQLWTFANHLREPHRGAARPDRAEVEADARGWAWGQMVDGALLVGELWFETPERRAERVRAARARLFG